MEGFWTIGELAKGFRVRPADVEYILRSRQIEASDRLGFIRLFDKAARDRIGEELANVKSERRGRPRRSGL